MIRSSIIVKIATFCPFGVPYRQSSTPQFLQKIFRINKININNLGSRINKWSAYLDNSHCSSKQKASNKTNHIINGNILSRNLSLLHYNKGSSLMENSLVGLEDLLGGQQPTICMLNEANLDTVNPIKVDSTTFPTLSQYDIVGSLPPPWI